MWSPEAAGKEGGRIPGFPRELCKSTEISSHTQLLEHFGPNCSICSNGSFAAAEARGRDTDWKEIQNWSPHYPLIAQDNMLPSKYMINFIMIIFCYLIFYFVY